MNHASKILFLILACTWILWQEQNETGTAMGKTVRPPAVWTMQQAFDTSDACEQAKMVFGKAHAQALKQDAPDAEVEALAAQG